ncbi:MAG TPA: UDP-N-acetylmuramoyl-L-alanine--D-glutamate ligase [Candidatus Kapabacteria bacterium]|nr:UDP-N-acetylmuramoyl-L-alanine--D-glutamate ligase [Candidatus Kapabacteria bacterium]
MNGVSTYSILGAARSGLAVAALLAREGAQVFVSDAKPSSSCGDAEERLRSLGVGYEFGGHSPRVLESSTLVLSPGVPDTIPIVAQARERGMAITNEIEIAAARCRAPIVAITGTNGKTTTTELAGFIFRAAGRRTFVAGNVGVPFSEIVTQADEAGVVVLETSSFQLEHIGTFKPKVAVILNVTPDHMDRYPDFEAYREAKLRIAMNQDAGDALLYNADDAALADLPGRFRSRAIGFSIRREVPVGAFSREGVMILRTPAGDAVREESVLPAAAIRIRGPHNLYNSMAAALAARLMDVPAGTIARALQEFAGVPHRLEPVRELDGVRYVNDSKATNVDSLWYALSSFSEPIVLIAGGRSKKNVYDAVLPLIHERVKAAVLIGDAADEMEQAFAAHTAIHRAGYSMENAVGIARSMAAPGDVVLLSPACASFDMFNNYEHRGDVFKSLVNALAPRSTEHAEVSPDHG